MTTAPEQLRARTKAFALRVIRLFQTLPKSEEARILGRQLLRSGTSVGANYRAVCVARSKAEFISRMAVVVEEGDEVIFWLELLHESGILRKGSDAELLSEAGELVRIFSASLRTARASRNAPERGQ